MQSDIDALGLPVEVVISGVNAVGYESGNSLAVTGNDIAFLQDTTLEDVWGAWAPVYRDVVVLDETNNEIAVYNLTANDLADPAQYDVLKQILIDAASP